MADEPSFHQWQCNALWHFLGGAADGPVIRKAGGQWLAGRTWKQANYAMNVDMMVHLQTITDLDYPGRRASLSTVSTGSSGWMVLSEVSMMGPFPLDAAADWGQVKKWSVCMLITQEFFEPGSRTNPGPRISTGFVQKWHLICGIIHLFPYSGNGYGGS